VRVRIRHTTVYTYSSPAVGAFTQLRLTPRHDETQNLLASTIRVTPQAKLTMHEDYFGGIVHAFNLNEPHDSLTIVALSDVVTVARRQPGRISRGDGDIALLSRPATKDRYSEWLAPSHFTDDGERLEALSEQARAYAADTANPDSARDVIEAVCTFVNGFLAYSPGATFVNTRVGEVIDLRAGVCQDFAHLGVAVLRKLGVPARYVSGYFHVEKDVESASPGDVHMESHAWIEAFIPRFGWWEYDPTNGCPADDRHIVVAVGRDYADVVPVSGVYRGEGEQTMAVRVEMVSPDAGPLPAPVATPARRGVAHDQRGARPPASAARRRAQEQAQQ
jgi:transglutaminase-like putative cysteine protease